MPFSSLFPKYEAAWHKLKKFNSIVRAYVAIWAHYLSGGNVPVHLNVEKCPGCRFLSAGVVCSPVKYGKITEDC